MGPEAMTRLCVTIGYDNANITNMLKTQYGLTEDAARDMLARVREHRLSAEEADATL
jgi:hypothetical protein